MSMSSVVAHAILKYNKRLAFLLCLFWVSIVAGLFQLKFASNDRAFFGSDNQEMAANGKAHEK